MQPYPSNTVTEDILILKHTDKICVFAAMLNPAITRLLAMNQPPDKKDDWNAVADLASRIQDLGLEGFPANQTTLPEKATELVDGILRRAALLNLAAVEQELPADHPFKPEMLAIVRAIQNYSE